MNSFRTTGLVLLVSLSFTALRAQAQSNDYGTPTLLPLPSMAPVLSMPASYSAKPSDSLGTLMMAAEDSAVADSAPAPVATPAPAKAMAAQSAEDTSLTDELWQDGCGCNDGCCNHWFGAAGGLVMGRNRANPFWTTYQTNNNVNQLMNTQNAGSNWAGGGQITVGYGFAGCGSCNTCNTCCGPVFFGPGIAVTYWGVGPMNGFSEITDPNNNLSTPINLNTQSGSVLIGANPASNFFDNSPDQRIWRSDTVNNFEVNLLQGAFINNGRFTMVGLAGLRYFRFDERLTYGSVGSGHQFGDQGGADEAYLSSRCVNNLFGVQVGALFNYMITNRVGVFVMPKVGIYGNQMNVRNQLYAGDGTQGFDISAHKSDISVLGEIDTGFDYAITPNWRAFIGYRVIGVAGLALGDNQFLPYLADNAGFAQVKQNGSLIMHGAMFGVAWLF